MNFIRYGFTISFWLMLSWAWAIPLFFLENLLLNGSSHWSLGRCSTGLAMRVFYPLIIIFFEYLLSGWLIHWILLSAYFPKKEKSERAKKLRIELTWLALGTLVTLIMLGASFALAIGAGIDSAQLKEREISQIQLGLSIAIGFIAITALNFILGQKSFFARKNLGAPIWIFGGLSLFLSALSVSELIRLLNAEDFPQIYYYMIVNTGCGG